MHNLGRLRSLFFLEERRSFTISLGGWDQGWEGYSGVDHLPATGCGPYRTPSVLPLPWVELAVAGQAQALNRIHARALNEQDHVGQAQRLCAR